MKRLKLNGFSALIIATILGSTMMSSQASQQTVNSISKMQLKYTVESNNAIELGIDCAALGADWASCAKVNVTLTNNETADIQAKDWAIYFHSIRRVLDVEDNQFTVTHITGDLHKLEPTTEFKGFPSGQSVTIPFIVEYWQLFETDLMPRWYVTATDAKAQVISNTDTEDLYQFISPITDAIWRHGGNDNTVLMTTATRYQKYKDTLILPIDNLRGQILPTPLSVIVNADDADLSAGVTMDLSSLTKESEQVLIDRLTALGIPTNGNYVIHGRVDPTAFQKEIAFSGAYKLTITPAKTEIVAYDSAGVFYGVQSLLSLISVASEGKKIATLTATDAPRFQYRGIFVDVARNFHSKAAILRLLDQMANYKLNKFHFHLSDDEGWRIAIPGLPELTEIGSKRCHDLTESQCLLPQLGSGPESNNNGSGFYSREDYIEIVKYAQARQIEVIPEIDMPAHARAAVMSMEARYRKLHEAGKEDEANQYRLLDPTDTSEVTSVQFYDRHSFLNPCLDSSKRFVNKLIQEISAMHKEAGQPLTSWHFGGDEAKNIYFGAGFQDKNGELVDGKGIIDQQREDKPWAKSHACQQAIKQGKVTDLDQFPSYFAIEVSKLIKANGIDRMQAWQDGLKYANSPADFATKRVSVNFWDTLFWGGYSEVNDWANKGYEVVISNADFVYLDMPYEADPQERGYYWASKGTDERKVFSFVPDNLPQNAELATDRDGNPYQAQSDGKWAGAYGLSAQLWSESVRTDEQMEYMLYPRLLAVAERAWHKAGWEQDYQSGKAYQLGKTQFVDQDLLLKDWTRFANIVGQRELAKLDLAGIHYRLPLFGAKVNESGQLIVNTSIPGVDIEYSVDGGKSWQKYLLKQLPKIKKGQTVQLRTASTDGKRHSRVNEITIGK